MTATKTTRPSSTCRAQAHCSGRVCDSSRSRFRRSFRRPRRAPDITTISCSADNGFRKLACGGTEPGIATSITTRPSSSPTSACIDVKLTVPQNEIVGASGVKVSEASNPDGTKTVIYHGDDIHDFAWTACPRYKVKRSRIPGADGAGANAHSHAARALEPGGSA